MCLGPTLAGRSRECHRGLGKPTIRTAWLRRREDVRGAGLRPPSLRSVRGARARGGREPVQPLAARRCSGRRRSSRRRPPGSSSRTRKSPRYLAHAQPPCTGWYQGGVVGQQACSRKWARRDGAARGAKPLGRGVQRWSNRSRVACNTREAARTRNTELAEPLARRPHRKPLGRGIQRWSNRSRVACNAR